ncbi:unnamed protein product, partial [Sphacelaria rigidula]
LHFVVLSRPEEATGYTLYCVLPRALPSYLVAPSDFSLLFSSFTFDPTNRAVPIEEYKDNLKSMVTHVRQVHPESKVLLIAPPTIHEVFDFLFCSD